MTLHLIFMTWETLLIERAVYQLLVLSCVGSLLLLMHWDEMVHKRVRFEVFTVLFLQIQDF